VSRVTPPAASNLASGLEPAVDRRDLWCLLLLAVIVALFFWRVVLAGQLLLPLDMLAVNEPWRSDLALEPPQPVWNWLVTDSLWSYYPMATNVAARWPGQVPLWDPHLMGGLPALAQGKLYSNPLFLLLELVLPVERAYSWLPVISLFIGAAGAFTLLRVVGCGRTGAVVGGLAFALNLEVVGWVLDPSVVSTSMWFPAVFLGVELALKRRNWRWAGLSAAAFALQILSGTILQAFYCAVSLALVSAFRGAWAAVVARRFAPLPCAPLSAIAALVTGALLAAVQLLPCLELYGQTPRGEAIGEVGLLPLKYLTLLAVPGFWGSTVHGELYWGFFNPSELALYFGLLPLFAVPFGLAAKDRGLAAALFGLGLATLLAVYAVPPFRQLVQLAYPVWLNTHPARIYVVTVFTWAMAAGLGVDWLVRGRPRRALALAAGAALALAAALATAPAALHALRPEKVYPARTRALLEGAGWAALAAGVLALGGSRRVSRRPFAAALVGIAALDLWAAGGDLNPAFDRSRLYPTTPSLDALRALVAAEPGPVRVLNVRSNLMLPGDSAQVYGFQTASGYSSWALSRAYDYARLTTHDNLALNFLYFDDCCGPLLDALNVRYVIADPGLVPAGALAGDPRPPLELVHDGPNRVYANRNALPRASLVHRVVEVDPGDREAAGAAMGPGFDPSREAVVEGRLGVRLDDPTRPDRVEIVSYEPERVEVRTSSDTAGLLVLADTMYPGWKAWVDGQPTPVLFTNILVRGALVPAGEHVVVFSFRPSSVRLGAAISAATLLAMVTALWFAALREPSRSTRRWCRS